jgi:IS5 family transposase
MSDPITEQELRKRPLYRRFAGSDGPAHVLDQGSTLRFRHFICLEKHQVPPGAGHYQYMTRRARLEAQD